MEINLEILACYIDGTATEEERNIVREYLKKNPKCYEEMLNLIERSKESSSVKKEDETAFYNICESRKTSIQPMNFSFSASSKATKKSNDESGFFSKTKRIFESLGCCASSSAEIIVSEQVKRRPKNNVGEQMLGMLDELDNIDL
jgi:hypothetical protein